MAAITNESGRFRFGENWRRFLRSLNEKRIAVAEHSLTAWLGDITGKSVLDIGSGSGLFSLAAARLGARKILSFDYDSSSVSCAVELKSRFTKPGCDWTVVQGSVLDEQFMSGLGGWDIVYSWGVLHHTGEMWRALENAASRVNRGGRLFIAIYNDQGWRSRYWLAVKRLYNSGRIGRTTVMATHMPMLWGARSLFRMATGRRDLERGMSIWHDAVDWLGGYPFEVASPEAIGDFFAQRGFGIDRTRLVGGRTGCNEYLFVRS